jgi:hypothetical protein
LCEILIKPEFSREIFEKSSTTKFIESTSSGSRVVQCGQTDGRTAKRKDRHSEAKVTCRNFAEECKTWHNVLFYLNFGWTAAENGSSKINDLIKSELSASVLERNYLLLRVPGACDLLISYVYSEILQL